MKRLLYALVGAMVGVIVAWIGFSVNTSLKSRGLPSFEWEVSSAAHAQTVPAAFDFRSAVRRVMPAVVSVDRLERFVNFWSEEVRIRPTGTGSGVIISRDGYILTNNHVVEDADVVQVRLPDKRIVEAKVVGTDPRSDLAVLKVDAPNLTPAVLGSSSSLEVGEWVIAVGNPLGYDNTVSAGIVSNKGRTLALGGRTVLLDAIQTDAAINQGNSGGALANARGEVVGINSAIITPNGGNVGIGFAIPIDRAKRIVSEIVRFGRVRYGSLGVVIYPQEGLLSVPRVRRVLAQEVGAEPPPSGLLIREAVGSGPFAPLDVLLEVNGRRTLDPSDLTVALADKRPGDVVRVRFWSRGRTQEVNVALKDL